MHLIVWKIGNQHIFICRLHVLMKGDSTVNISVFMLFSISDKLNIAILDTCIITIKMIHF